MSSDDNTMRSFKTINKYRAKWKMPLLVIKDIRCLVCRQWFKSPARQIHVCNSCKTSKEWVDNV